MTERIGSPRSVRTGSIPRTGVPFATDEYERRVRAVVGQFEAAGIDAFAATAEASQRYLAGYDGRGDYFAPFPLIVTPKRAPTYVVRRYDEDAVRTESWIEDVRPYTQEGDQPRVWADALRSLGMVRGRLGLELRSWTGQSVRRLGARR